MLMLSYENLCGALESQVIPIARCYCRALKTWEQWFGLGLIY